MLDQAERLRQLVNNNLADKNKPEHSPRIITVTSGKGGVGKSNLVVNLAITLQKLNNRVLILDADVGMGNDDVLMGIVSRYNIYDVIFKNLDLNKIIVDGPLGVKLLPAGTATNYFEPLNFEQINKFTRELFKLGNLDYIIIDTGAGINDTVLSFIKCCDEVIVITTPEPTSMTDAYSLLKAISKLNIKNKCYLIANKVSSIENGIKTFRKFKAVVDRFLTVELSYLGSILEDKKVVESVCTQIPFVLKYANASCTRDVINIARKLIGNKKVNNKTTVEGFFRKLFNIFS